MADRRCVSIGLRSPLSIDYLDEPQDGKPTGESVLPHDPLHSVNEIPHGQPGRRR